MGSVLYLAVITGDGAINRILNRVNAQICFYGGDNAFL